jgi:hypothetical protein
MLLRGLLGAVAAVVLSYVSFLTITYMWPRFAGEPTLEGGLVTLGYPAPGTQLLWLQCNDACKMRACAQHEERQACIERLRPSVSVRPAGSADWLQSERHVRILPQEHLLPLINATVFELFNLQPCTRYEYRASVVAGTEAEANMLITQDKFRSAPAADQAGCNNLIGLSSSSASDAAAVAPSSSSSLADVRMLFGSCLGTSIFSDLRVFRWVLERANASGEVLDLVLLLGDTVYTDIPVLADEVAYGQVWSDPAFSALFHRVPFVATYDDHELINDWSLVDSHERYEGAMRFFDEWVGAKNPPPPPAWDVARQGPLPILPPPSLPEPEWALAPSSPANRPRYFNFSYGSLASFFVLDTRQYASPPSNKGGPSDPRRRTKLGMEQLAQLKAWLLVDTAPFKFLCSSVAWSSLAWKPRPDGWSDFEVERDGIFDFIAAHGLKGVTLLSADLHWSGSFHFTKYNLHEATVSPLQSFGLPSWNPPDTLEETQTYLSEWANHAGLIELHAGPKGVVRPSADASAAVGSGAPTTPRVVVHAQAPGALLNISVFKYNYGTPKRHRSIVWRWDDMDHSRPVTRSLAQHEDIS